MRKRAAGALGAGVAVVVLLLGTLTGQAAPGPSEAFGVLVTGIIEPPQPHVKSTDGTEKSESLATLPDNPLINAELAKVTAGDSRASVQLVGVKVLPGVAGQTLGAADSGLPPALTGLASVCDQDPLPEQLPPEAADLLPPQLSEGVDPAELCAFVQSAEPAALSLEAVSVGCAGTKPEVKIAGLAVLGQEIEIPLDPEPNTEVPLGPLGSILFNRQATDGGLFTVQGAVVNLTDQAAIVLASASCGMATVEKPLGRKPTPVTTNLPVVG